MLSGLKLKITAACIVACSFASAAKAQLASDRSLTVIYNKKINEKLAKKNKSKELVKQLDKQQNLPSSKSSLKDVAKLTIKNPGIAAHNNSTQSAKEKKDVLPSSSPKLKQMGIPASPSQRLPLH